MNLATFNFRTATSDDIYAAQKQLRAVSCYNGGLDRDWGDWCKAGLYVYQQMQSRGGYIAKFVNRSPILVIPGDGDGGRTRVCWPGPAEADGDGGPNIENDPCWQPDTSLHHDGHPINSRVVEGIVMTIGEIDAVKEICLGAQAWIRNIETETDLSPAVVYDTGGSEDDGEMSIAACKKHGIPWNPRTGGTTRPIMWYEVEPGTPAVVDNTTFSLQALMV